MYDKNSIKIEREDMEKYYCKVLNYTQNGIISVEDSL